MNSGINVKYLQYGVYRAGLCNQLMSLELGVGLAYLTGRVLVPVLDTVAIPPGQTLIRGAVEPYILDLFDVPIPIIIPGQQIPMKDSDLVCRDFDCNLVETGIYFPNDFDVNDDDARAFAEGRPLKTFDDSLQAADVIRLFSRNTLGFYSYVFYVPKDRKELFGVILRIRPKKYYSKFAEQVRTAIGSAFNAVHIRRTDFRNEDSDWVHPSVDTILENMRKVLPRDELLLICTDEPDRSWFRPILAEYKSHLFLDDFILTRGEFPRLPFSGNAVQALITMLVAAESDRFIGTMLSTFTAVIQRWRGQKGKELRFQYTFNAVGKQFKFENAQMIETKSGPYSWNRLEQPDKASWSWAREWPECLADQVLDRNVERRGQSLGL